MINGTKRYITNAPYAGVFLLMARTDPNGKGGAGISALPVDADTPGITVGPIPKMLGQIGSASTEVYFEDCRVPVSALVGDQEGRGLGASLRGINHARTHVVATCVGQAMRMIDAGVVDFAIGREQFGGLIADMPSIQNLLADSHTEMLAAKAMTLEAARAFDRSQAEGTRLPTTEIAAAKYFASEMVSRVADRALQIMGGAGFMEGNPITRLYRDTRLFRIFEGTSQIQQRNIARDIVRARRANR
ncbi:MAG: acyl-CoA dehydrogenase [Proteobacteria bacterium]|nr:acyl-CoA dehydrogenase [Pseudomonadota bacterium]